MSDGATAEVRRARGEAADPRRWYALGLLCVTFFMVVLGATSVFTAAPSIARGLGFSAEGVQWVFTVYAVAVGGLLLFGGRVADAWGRRRAFMAGVGLFVLSSLLCGLASSTGMLIGARAVQGASAAVLSPAALSLVISAFPDGAERNKALGAWSAIGGTGATAGLLVGGLLTGGWGWRWIFFINVPVGVIVLALGPLLLPESQAGARRRGLDPAGAVTITAALVALVYAITQAPRAGWASTPTIGLLVLAAGLIALFGLVEAGRQAPLLPLRLLRSRVLVGGNLVMLVAGMSVDGMLFVLTLYTQQVLGYSAIDFGLVMAVMTATSIVGSYAAQRVATKVGARPVASAGMVLLAASCGLLTRITAHDSALGVLLPSLMLFGLGMGAAFVAGSIAALTGVAEHDSGVAAGLQNTTFNIGTALGVAILSTVATAHAAAVRARPDAPPPPDVLTEGDRYAFVAAVFIAAVGLLAALTTLGPLRRDNAMDEEWRTP